MEGHFEGEARERNWQGELVMQERCEEMQEVTEAAAHKTSYSRLQTELRDLTEHPRPGYRAAPKGDSLYNWTATVTGVKGTVYENGLFFLDITFPIQYPFVPPKVTFRTRIYHCNINGQGTLFLDMLDKNWKPSYSVAAILEGIISLLCQCDPGDPVIGEIGRKYVENREEHDRIAKEWTARFA